MKMSAEKLIGVKGKVIHSQSREIINNVIKFMKEEAVNGSKIPLTNFRERVLAATGISLASYNRITKISKQIESGASTSFSTPHKKRPRISRKLDVIGAGLTNALRELIYDFYIIEKKRPSLKGILQKMKDAGFPFTGSISTLRKLLKNMGFTWRKTDDNRSVLMESFDIRLKRTNYLKALTKYREEGRPIIYTDETYLHSSHTQPKGWSDGKKGLKRPLNKGKRLIIVHAGGKGGFIPNGLLIFRSGIKSGDYHDDMNHTNFCKWVESQLIPNLPPKAVLVVDNASYHNVQINKSPTSGSRKNEMINWLTKHKIEHNPKLTKPELYKIIKDNKEQEITYHLDVLLKQHDHKVLRLPPYHPELNPIEKIWAMVKNRVAARNTTFKLNDVEALAREEFSIIGPDEWNKLCNHTMKYERELMEKEHLLDNFTDSLVFTVNTGSSDEDSDSECSDSDDGLSGIEPLS